MAVGIRSIGVGEGGVVMVAVAVVTSPHSRVVHPWVGLRISLGLGRGLSNRLGLSLFHSNNGLLRRSCDSGGCNNSGGYERSVGAWNKDSSVGDKRSIGQGMSVGQGVIGVGEDSRGGIRKGGVSLGLCAGECSEGYHQQELHVDAL